MEDNKASLALLIT